MKLLRIQLSNYRQYKGNQEIILSSDDKNNFTIIQGANGSGKTNILNAITWCLYGEEEHLSKYPKKMNTINESVLYELRENSVAECTVKLIFGDKEPEYTIERSFSIRKTKTNIERFNENFVVMLKTGKNWIEAPGPDFVVRSKILPYKIRKFFLFDGERLDEFFRSGGNEYIKEAVLDVAQIGLLDEAYDHLDDTTDQLRHTVSKELPETEDTIGKIEAYKKSKKELESDLEKAEKDKKKAQENLEEIQNYLRNHSVELVKKLQQDRDELTGKIEIIDNQIKEKKEENRDRILINIPLIFGRSAIQNCLKLIEKESEKGRLPPQIRDKFIKELLERGKCICGSDISKNNEHRKCIERLLETIIPSKIADQIDDAKYLLDDLLKRSKIFKKQSSDFVKNINKLDKDKKDFNEKLADIKIKIGSQNIDEVKSAESQREGYLGNISRASEDIGLLKAKIGNCQTAIDTLDKEFQEKIQKKKEMQSVIKKIEFCDKCLKVLSEIKLDTINSIRKLIETKTKQYFLNLIWKKKTYTDIMIDPDYSISVISKDGTSCLGSLSAGERQVLALSFMAALYEVSGFDAPVIIDTPLGRISDEPRENIAKSLPEYLKNTQVTLLVTDAEYSSDVRDNLKKRVGKEYKLEFDEDMGETKVNSYGN